MFSGGRHWEGIHEASRLEDDYRSLLVNLFPAEIREPNRR